MQENPNGVEGRVCNSCKIYKTRDNFSKHKRCKNGLYGICYACNKIKRKAFYEKNKDRLLKKQKEKRNTDEYRKKANKRQSKYRKNNPTKMLWIWAKNKSLKKGIEFNLEEKDIIYTGICPILGIELEIGGEDLNNSPTLDRINPYKGYTKGNVLIISHLANRIKNQGTIDQIRKILEYMEKNEGSK